jgi:hypothetical protein
VKQSSLRLVFKLALVFVGLFGAAFAISGALTAMPAPSVGGTCGPSRASETSIEAFFDPASIGAGAEPSSSHAEARFEWLAFVGQCQALADARVFSTFVILVVSLDVALLGFVLVLREPRRRRIESQAVRPEPPIDVTGLAPSPLN